MPDPIDYNAQCDELVYSTFNSIDGKIFASKEACVQELLSGNDKYNSLTPEYRQQVADRLWTHYERPYIRKILNAIDPGYFKIEKPSAGHNSPQTAIQTKKLSRVFDELPYYIRSSEKNVDLMGEEVIDAYLNDFLLYGREFAQAKLLNPLLSELIDFEKSALRNPFVDKHIGEETYKTLDEADVVNGFASACKMLVDSIINDFYREKLALAAIYLTSAGVSASARQEENAQNNSKLYDEKKKYLFCQAMSYEIFECASSNQNSRVDREIIQYSIDLMKEKSQIFEKFLENEENSQKLFAQLCFDYLLNDLNKLNKNPEQNAQSIKEIRAIIQKYDYDHQMNLEQLPRVNFPLNDLNTLNENPEKNAPSIEKTRTIIQKYDYDPQMNLKQLRRVNFRRGLSVFFTLLFVGAAVAIGFFTFGAGTAAIISLIPAIAPYLIPSFVTSAVIAVTGFFSSLYLAWKSRSISQSIASFEAESQALQPAPISSIDTSGSTIQKLHETLRPSQGNQQVLSSSTSSMSSKDALPVDPTVKQSNSSYTSSTSHSPPDSESPKPQ